jgi:radical SAM superfamily enzyme YgiQ (UPF0313 family)
MRLYLINPSNPLVAITNVGASRLNRFRVWKPLNLLVIAGLTPADWEITLMDENLGIPDYAAMPRPDLVGITAFTSQASRAYDVAGSFRALGVPVVMGGIHATMCREEAALHVDAIVTGEAEAVWADLLEDVKLGRLRSLYEGGHADMSEELPARHDLLYGPYAAGAIQTSRGCPLQCSFCSVTSFNGARFRQRPIDHVVEELATIREKMVLFVDDNLIGTSRAHVARAKELFRAIIRAKLDKEWIAQATVNVAEDEELLSLAAEAGCRGMFIGFESPTLAGMEQIGKKSNLCKDKDLRASVRSIQRHGILVAGSFIIGLDGDAPGIGRLIAKTAAGYGVDFLNVLFLTPLPGTLLWNRMASRRAIVLDTFPADWSYYTLTYPVARYENLTLAEAAREMLECEKTFYSLPRILARLAGSIWRRQSSLVSLAGNLSYRGNIPLDREDLARFMSLHGTRYGDATEVGRGDLVECPTPSL